MKTLSWLAAVTVAVGFLSNGLVAGVVIRNEKVVVAERTLAPGGALPVADGPSVILYLDAGSVAAPGGPAAAVARGEVVFQPGGRPGITNTGRSPLRVVVTGYRGAGGPETWGAAGLAPDYRLRFENRYGRVYDIRMPAGRSEPLHSHHDRVVICLSGAQLRHEMPDGRTEVSSLRTGEVAWRRGGTHAGHNLGATDLWVIAIEPK